jgi:hypothetical protein
MVFNSKNPPHTALRLDTGPNPKELVVCLIKLNMLKF